MSLDLNTPIHLPRAYRYDAMLVNTIPPEGFTITIAKVALLESTLEHIQLPAPRAPLEND